MYFVTRDEAFAILVALNIFFRIGAFFWLKRAFAQKKA
jgi:hypothetical protein